MVCYDGVYRCRHCVYRHAELRGWAEVPSAFKQQDVVVNKEHPVVDLKSVGPVETYEQPRML